MRSLRIFARLVAHDPPNLHRLSADHRPLVAGAGHPVLQAQSLGVIKLSIFAAANDALVKVNQDLRDAHAKCLKVADSEASFGRFEAAEHWRNEARKIERAQAALLPF